jgi:hypothetical protein
LHGKLGEPKQKAGQTVCFLFWKPYQSTGLEGERKENVPAARFSACRKSSAKAGLFGLDMV